MYGYDGFMQNRMTVPDGSTRQRKNHQVDGYMTGTNLLVRTDRLSAFIKHATCHSLNGRCIGSKRRFVFRALPIYIRRLTLSFFNFHSENICQSEAVNLVREIRRGRIFADYTNRHLSSAKFGRRRPQVSLEEFSFLEKICRKTTPEERTWAKLVNPRTIHWYCDGPEPTQEAIRYDERVHKQMDDAKRRALIKSQAVKKRESGEVVPKVSASAPKRKPTSKSDRPFKQPKVSLEPVVGLMAEGVKTVTPAKKGTGKGLMTAPEGKQERPPSLLRDDSKYALEKLSSIITAEDYEDLGNHSTEAMGETGLFSVAQSLVMMKGLLDRCLNRESTLDRVRAKAQQTEEELGQLQRWRSKMEKKLELSEQARKELEEKTATSLTVIENKEAEIKQLKEDLRQAKVAAVEEYRCSESCLSELSDSFLQGFDDSLRQVKKAYPELDLTMVKLEDQAQTSALPVASENTEDLFGDGAAQGDGESAPSKDVPVAEEKKD
ncbi:uncharacterized protein LOC126697499 isoform X1 [Quercus robur]|uniref:uncharacterized protein LOC126697499 isoform X1 n=2 Tax=Quercus robur TaxID=38942 RepID=UPI00216189BE|nr:uncharacterized protein LOC126697499 isoform X1 [Quercus robur]